MITPVIGATHVLCAIGSGTDQAWASARAGIARIGNSHVMDKHFEPIQMGLVPEDALAALTPEIEELPLPSRARRMLRLTAPAFHAVAGGLPPPVRLFIGLPELLGADPRWLAHVPAYLEKMTGVKVDRARSSVVPQGRASVFIALEQAITALASDPEAAVLVGGVDTYLDLRLLGELDAEGRILGPRVMDGFIPGEGAAFLVLTSGSAAGRQNGVGVAVAGAASAPDAGHRYGDAPARGEGLSAAIETLRARMTPPPPPIQTTFAGFNGESFDAKAWGVARVRHSDLFAPTMVIEHPADKYGDAGAATGAILLALAARALASGTRPGPALVWAASDRAARGCAVLTAHTPT